MNWRVHFTLAATALVLACPTQAVTVFEGDTTHVIDYTLTDSALVSYSRVHVRRGGQIVGVNDGTPSSRGAVTFGWAGAVPSSPILPTSRSTLEMSGNARVSGDDNQRGVWFQTDADIRMRDDATITGGQMLRPDGTSFLSGISMDRGSSYLEDNAAHRLYMDGRATVNGQVFMDGFVRMTGNSVINGNFGSGSLGLEMYGGTINGQLALGSLGYHTVLLDGGSILGGLGHNGPGGPMPPSLVHLDMRSGFIGTRINTRGSLDADIRGGTIEGGIRIDTSDWGYGASHLLFSGGSLNTSSDGWLLDLFYAEDPFGTLISTLDIWGGQFGHTEAGQGFRLDGWYDFNIYGWDWTYSNNRLSGYLSDGNRIDVGLTFGPNWRGLFTMHDVGVPEPGPLLLFVFGITALGLRRKLVSH